MLSSDKNVETIAQLAEIVKHYLGIQTEYLKLDIVEKLVRLLTFFALSIVFFLILVGVAIFCSLAFAFWPRSRSDSPASRNYLLLESQVMD